MKTFIIPEIEIRDLSPSQSVMDDITISKNPVMNNEMFVYWNKDFANDEAIW